MNRHIPFRLLLWPAALTLVAGLVALAVVVLAAKGARRGEESDKAEKPPRNDNPGEVTVKNGSANYEVVRAKGVRDWTEPVTVYGRVVPNPQATFEVRTAFAGTLRPDKTGWLAPGRKVKAGQTLCWVDLRVDPQVRLDLRNKLNEALQQERGAVETRKKMDARVKRYEKAKGLALREREDARIQQEAARTREAVARAAVRLWTAALGEIDRAPRTKDSVWTTAVKAPADGEVAELLAQPGTAVAAGAAVVRVIDFRRLWVRLDFPPEVLARGAPPGVEVRAGHLAPPSLRGTPNQSFSSGPGGKVPAARLHAASHVDPASQFVGYYYEVDAARTGFPWRPGLLVRAEVKGLHAADSPAQDAVQVPATAVLYHQGRAVIYLFSQRGKKTTTYKRCEVQVLGREGKDYVLAINQDLEAGTRVVASGAQVLLSEEFNQAADDD
jgi:biotin carboxyl carrier protein